MSVNQDVPELGQETTDLDAIIRKWGAEKFGCEVEKVDSSDVKISQLSVVYQSDKDWFTNVPVHEEIFDNPHDDTNSTWRYNHTARFTSLATWRITRGFTSSLLPSMRLAIDFPVSEEGKRPLRGTFLKTGAGETAEATEGAREWEVDGEVNVKPLTTTKAAAAVRVCRLKNVKFSTDIMLYGLVKLHASSKKTSKLGKSSDISSSIEEILSSNTGFTTMEQPPSNSDVTNDSYGANNKRVFFRIEGTCTGEVGLGAIIQLSEVQSLV